MTYKKNTQRENLILSYWRSGHTIETISLKTGIPSGSVGYYVKKFNKNPEKYQKVIESKFQDPPRSSPSTIALAAFSWDKIFQNYMVLFEQGRFGEARDYLECLLLIGEVYKRFSPILHDFKWDDLIKVVENLNVLNLFDKGSFGTINVSSSKPNNTPQATVPISNSESLSDNVNAKSDQDIQDKKLDPKHLEWNPITGKYDDSAYSFDKTIEAMSLEARKKRFIPI